MAHVGCANKVGPYDRYKWGGEMSSRVGVEH